MRTQNELLLDGSYEYFSKGVLYAQENFSLYRIPDQKNYELIAEVFSRLENGELLKVNVKMSLNSQYYPTYLSVENSLGDKYTYETFHVDLLDQRLKYVFKNKNFSHDYNQSFDSKRYLTSPAFSTSCLFTLTRNFDATGKTILTFINSTNEWEYQSNPSEKIVYAEYKARTLTDYSLHGSTHHASHVCLYESDEDISGVDIYISKHYGIPYELIDNDLNIKIKNLKKHEVD